MRVVLLFVAADRVYSELVVLLFSVNTFVLPAFVDAFLALEVDVVLLS